MEANKYRLEKVLEIRNHARDETARLLALKMQLLEQAEVELSLRRMNLQACYERQNKAQTLLNKGLRKGIQAKDVIAHQNYLDDLRRNETSIKAEIEEQLQVVSRAEGELEAAREKLIESARELKSIEVHKSNWQSVRNSESQKKEQKINDEIGAILHGRNKKMV